MLSECLNVNVSSGKCSHIAHHKIMKHINVNIYKKIFTFLYKSARFRTKRKSTNNNFKMDIKPKANSKPKILKN